jgi:hypothetical protein
MGRGAYMGVGKEFDVSLDVAKAAAELLCNLYCATLEEVEAQDA